MGYLYRAVRCMDKQNDMARRLARIGASQEERKEILELARIDYNTNLDGFVKKCEHIENLIREGNSIDEIKKMLVNGRRHG